MGDIYSEVLGAIKKGERAALATIIARTGYAPRAVGAKYLIRGDGSSSGTIGGGCVEAEVWQKAQDVMERGQAQVLQFKLTAEQLAEGGLICGGNIDILVEPLSETFSEIFKEVKRIKQRGGEAVLATLVSVDGDYPKGGGTKALFKSSGEKAGFLPDVEGIDQWVLKESASLIKEKKTRLLVFQPEGEGSFLKKAEILLEPILSEPTVYLFGAGHVSQQIAPLAKKVLFKVVVIDDREVFANRERFPDSDEILVSEFEGCFNHLPIDDSSYIIIVTRGHLYDGAVLEQAVKTNARYIGMIGSRKKIHILYQQLMKKGVSREALNRVYAPIGLEIHSETPEEIAVSIVAQLIQVRGETS